MKAYNYTSKKKFNNLYHSTSKMSYDEGFYCTVYNDNKVFLLNGPKDTILMFSKNLFGQD